MKQIVVIGANTEHTPELLELAEKIGEEIAKRGALLICGGREGIMEAASRGAKKHNGTTVAILPGPDRAEANQYMDIVIPTGIGFARNALVARAGDAVIAISGGCGTMSELGLAWGFNKPIVAVTGHGGWSEKVAGTSLDGKPGHIPIEGASTAEEAVEKAFKLINEKK